jgi:chromosome segregation ATPase
MRSSEFYAWLAASLAVTGPAWAQQSAAIASPAPEDSQAARMRAGLTLLNDEKAAAENRAIALSTENEAAQAQIGRLNEQLKAAQAEIATLKAAALPVVVPDKKP